LQGYKPDNTTHTGQKAPRVATVHDTIKESGWVLSRPSAVFHVYASTNTSWVTQTLSHCTLVKRGKISSNSSTYEATQFGDSICPVCVSTFECLFNRAQPMRALIDTGGGYHLEAPNFRSDHSPSLPSCILYFPLIALVSLIINHSISYSSSPHSKSQTRV
jgi:hypothetical protein